MADPRNRHRGDDAYEGLRRLRSELRAAARARGEEPDEGGGEPGGAGPAGAAGGTGRGGRRPGQGRRPLRRWPRRTLITANVVVALLLIGTASTYGYVKWRLGQINHVNVLGLSITGRSAQSQSNGSSIPPFTLLVVGSDTRNLGSGSSPAFGSTGNSGGGVNGQRSDSIILMRVNPKYGAIGLLSIPRDTLANVPGYGFTRVNTAFNTGNPTLLVQVLNQDFNIQVNHFAEFNFDTFRQVSDAIGGVEQWFPTPARDLFSNLVVNQAGCVNLTGDQALAFVRSREYQYYLNGSWQYQAYPESDLARIQRQQSFVRDAIHKAKRVAPTNPIALNGIIGGITKNLTLDSGFSDSLLLKLAERFRSANLSNLPSWTYPTVNSQQVSGALDVDPAQDAQVVKEWLDVGQPPTPTPSTSKPSSPATTVVNPSSVSIEVENGSGTTGQAATAANQLQKAGYQATVNGSYATYGNSGTVIYYAPDSLAAAKQLQGQLVGGATLAEDSSLTSSRYNLRVVTGQNWNGLNASSASSSGSSSTSSTSTTQANPAINGSSSVNPSSSSFYHGVYVPPGLTPGQTPQTCGE